MVRMGARVLLRIGIGLLIMSVVIRPAIQTPHGMMGDNLAIVACLALIITAALGMKFAGDEQVSKKNDDED